MTKVNKHKKHKIKKKILIPALAVLAVLFLTAAAYLGDYYRAEESALVCLETTADVTVTETDGNFVFAPEDPAVGVIFYPGGKVQAESYAPLMKALAERDILSVLVPMPANLAVFGMNKADGIAEDFPEVDTWYMAGHSLGGSMAASYLAKHQEEFEGLILLASYSTEDLSDSNLSVLSVYGDQDGVLNMESYEKYRENLPDGWCEVVIEGGCHACFGAYGEQDGDGEAVISREEQIGKTVEAILGITKEE